MTHTSKIFTTLAIAVACILIFVFFIKNIQTQRNTARPDSNIGQEALIGCYQAGNDRDVYTLAIESFDNDTVSGSLDFDNYEKDSSSGEFVGTFQDDILIGDYTFTSEGLLSTMQVAFKKQGDYFVRGYGPVDETGTRFADVANITYEENVLSVFTSVECTNE